MFTKLEKFPVAIACSLPTIRLHTGWDPVMVEYFLALYNTDKKQKNQNQKTVQLYKKKVRGTSGYNFRNYFLNVKIL